MPLEQVQLRPIGYVQTPYTSLAETPIQTSRNPDEPGRLVLLQGTGQRVGLFATRSPVRPNDLALSLDRVRGGWYQQHDTAANPLVRPGDQGLRGVGLDRP
jgi:tRNA (Thr-GGU) A37 N-methylase